MKNRLFSEIILDLKVDNNFSFIDNRGKITDSLLKKYKDANVKHELGNLGIRFNINEDTEYDLEIGITNQKFVISSYANNYDNDKLKKEFEDIREQIKDLFNFNNLITIGARIKGQYSLSGVTDFYSSKKKILSKISMQQQGFPFYEDNQDDFAITVSNNKQSYNFGPLKGKDDFWIIRNFKKNKINKASLKGFFGLDIDCFLEKKDITNELEKNVSSVINRLFNKEEKIISHIDS